MGEKKIPVDTTRQPQRPDKPRACRMDDALSPLLVFRRKERPRVIADGFETKFAQDVEIMRRWEKNARMSDVKHESSDEDEDRTDLLDFDEKMPSNMANEMQIEFVCEEGGRFWYRPVPDVDGKSASTDFSVDDDDSALRKKGAKVFKVMQSSAKAGAPSSTLGKRKMDEESMIAVVDAVAESKAKDAVQSLLQNCTIETLKCILSDHKLKVSAKEKDEYVSRIMSEAVCID